MFIFYHRGHREPRVFAVFKLGSEALASPSFEWMQDAIIATTAMENYLPLSTANTKHFRSIKELDVKAFKP